MGSRTIHCGLSVRGQLVKTDAKLRKDWKNAIKVDGRYLTEAWEIRNAFMDELSKGREVLPFGDECEGWDYKTGCPGHPTPEATPALKNSDLQPPEVPDGG